jgi:hypothetical protein
VLNCGDQNVTIYPDMWISIWTRTYQTGNVC